MRKFIKNIPEIVRCWYWYIREDNKRSKIAKDRLKTCMSCNYLDKGCTKNKVLQFFFKKAWRCSICKCYIYAKVYSDKLPCDMGFWDK